MRYVHPTTAKINAVNALERQMVDLNKHNIGSLAKSTSIQKSCNSLIGKPLVLPVRLSKVLPSSI